MITQWFLDFLLTPLFTLADLIPNTTAATAWINTYAGYGSGIGPYLGSASGVVPVDLVLTVLSTLAALLPAIATYKTFSWVWRHVPTIAGFGTGNG